MAKSGRPGARVRSELNEAYVHGAPFAQHITRLTSPASPMQKAIVGTVAAAPSASTRALSATPVAVVTSFTTSASDSTSRLCSAANAFASGVPSMS